MKRGFRTIAILALSLGLASIFLLRAGTAAAEEKCTVAVKGDSPTARACQRGGRPEARRVMKAMITAAGGKGVKFSCDNCHQSLVTYELTKDAVENYKKLQAASGIN
jgi:hypothetical protein